MGFNKKEKEHSWFYVVLSPSTGRAALLQTFNQSLYHACVLCVSPAKLPIYNVPENLLTKWLTFCFQAVKKFSKCNFFFSLCAFCLFSCCCSLIRKWRESFSAANASQEAAGCCAPKGSPGQRAQVYGHLPETAHLLLPLQGFYLVRNTLHFLKWQ